MHARSESNPCTKLSQKPRLLRFLNIYATKNTHSQV